MANIPIETITKNNDGNTYVIKDANAIPKTGSNQISGDLVPTTDNSIDIGSSTKNLKMLYTKGITIGGKTVDTDANGNMVYDGHIVDAIEEQGDGYIRYSNGLQICWGKIPITSSSNSWGNLYDSTGVYENYPKSFISAPVVTAGSIGENYCMIEMAKGNSVRTPTLHAVKPITFTNIDFTINYIAIGMWK